MKKLQRWKIHDVGVDGFDVEPVDIEIYGAEWCKSEDVAALETELEAARGEIEQLKCCGNCWKYPAANDERVCGHYGGAAGHDTEHNDECWEQRKGNMQLTEFKKRKTLQRYSFDREGSWAANDGKWYWRNDVLELENDLEQAEAEKERLKKRVEELEKNIKCKCPKCSGYALLECGHYPEDYCDCKD